LQVLGQLSEGPWPQRGPSKLRFSKAGWNGVRPRSMLPSTFTAESRSPPMDREQISVHLAVHEQHRPSCFLPLLHAARQCMLGNSHIAGRHKSCFPHDLDHITSARQGHGRAGLCPRYPQRFALAASPRHCGVCVLQCFPLGSPQQAACIRWPPSLVAAIGGGFWSSSSFVCNPWRPCGVCRGSGIFGSGIWASASSLHRRRRYGPSAEATYARICLASPHCPCRNVSPSTFFRSDSPPLQCVGQRDAHGSYLPASRFGMLRRRFKFFLFFALLVRIMARVLDMSCFFRWNLRRGASRPLA